MDILYFTFNGVSSEHYNMMIQNTGEDLVFPSQPNFENITISPKYQGVSYNVGTDYKARSFSFNCWIDSLREGEIHSLLTWLETDKVGELVLSYNSDYYYEVKIASITDFKHFLRYSEDGTNYYNYEFSITFETVGDFAAISILDYPAVSETGNFKSLEVINGASYLYNWGTLPTYVVFKSLTPSFTIKIDDKTYYEYNESNNPFTINSQHGFCLNNNGDLVEETAENPYINLGALKLDPVNQVLVTFEVGNISYKEKTIFKPNTKFFFKGENTSYTKTELESLASNSLYSNKTLVVEYCEPYKIAITGTVTFKFKKRNKY